MRRRVVFAIVPAVSIAGGFVACGLDENGQANDGGMDVTVKDAPIDAFEASLPDVQSCTTLNVSACSDAALPSGWQYVAVALQDAACPSLAYGSTPLVYSLSPQNGTCTCVPSIDGGYSCGGPVIIGGNNGSCNGAGSGSFDAGPGLNCFDPNWGDQHISVILPTATGSPTCSTTVTGNATWTGKAVTMCAPACDASDFCGLGAPFARCISSPTGGTCPAPFTVPQPVIGSATSVVASCGGCGGSVSPPPTCDASVIAYSNSNNCEGGTPSTVDILDGSCISPGGGGSHISSVSYTASTPPAATCTTDGSTGSAIFGASFTVCCLP